MEHIRTALDTRDRVAAHSGDLDHHAKEGLIGTVAELTAVPMHAESPPKGDAIRTSLDIKDRLAAHGVTMPETEAVWREELEEGVEEALK